MADHPFVGNPGDFDPDEAPAVDPAAAGLADELLDAGWRPDRIKRIVRAQGIGTHELIGVGETDWLWKPSELDALGEPLAELLNRFPTTRAAAAVSDELTVGAVMLEYSFRSIRERRRVLRARQEAEQAPPAPGPPIGQARAFSTGYAPEDVGAEPVLPVNPQAPPAPSNGDGRRVDDPSIWKTEEYD